MLTGYSSVFGCNTHQIGFKTLLLYESKADLVCFLSEQPLLYPFGNTEVVVSGGFEDERRVQSTKPPTNFRFLATCYKEADTRVILHGVNSEIDRVVVDGQRYLHFFTSCSPLFQDDVF